LTDRFKWDFTSEPDDDAPVVVECVEWLFVRIGWLIDWLID
jgi:hypothetical protein